jgi:hypothetical protein
MVRTTWLEVVSVLLNWNKCPCNILMMRIPAIQTASLIFAVLLCAVLMRGWLLPLVCVVMNAIL